jgi:hypothetical protein
MRNQWEAFDDYDEVEIPVTTNNPIRKINKKIRKKEQSYEKNPSPELYNEILQLKKQLKDLTTEPVKKPKKRKFKKRRIDKAQKAKERKWKREKEFEEKKERMRQERNVWMAEEKERRANEKERRAEENERRSKQREKWQKREKQREKEKENSRKRPQQTLEKQREKDDALKLLYIKYPRPMDIINWFENPTKQVYFMLMKKYHPDKNNNKDNIYTKIVTSYWHTITKT